MAIALCICVLLSFLYEGRLSNAYLQAAKIESPFNAEKNKEVLSQQHGQDKTALELRVSDLQGKNTALKNSDDTATNTNATLNGANTALKNGITELTNKNAALKIDYNALQASNIDL